MGYHHMFYGLDLDRLEAVFGSKNANFTAEILRARKQDFKDLNQQFEDDYEDFPKCEQALREFVAGSFGDHEHAKAMYGYALQIICEHIGQRVGGDDVASIADHPYASQLVASGPPIPIPYDKSDFPEIGFLSWAQIPDEIKRIDAAPRRPKRSLVLSIVSLLTSGRAGHQMSKAEVAEDMAAYRKTLTEALDKNLAIVSFRY
jgi:hypothetical protein